MALTYSAATSVTATLTSITNATWYHTTAVDNSSDLYLDAHVGGSIQIGAVGADGYIDIYAYGSYDGTTYTAGLTGSAGAITWGTTGTTGVDGYYDLAPFFLGSIVVDTTDDNDDKKFGPFSVASRFGILLPIKWGLVFYNGTDTTTHATGTNNEIQFIGLKL
jgi:hypothetical protein